MRGPTTSSSHLTWSTISQRDRNDPIRSEPSDERVEEKAARFGKMMVGDQPSDLAAATQAGTDFIAIVDLGEAHDWARPFPVVSDFPAFVSMAATDVS